MEKDSDASVQKQCCNRFIGSCRIGAGNGARGGVRFGRNASIGGVSPTKHLIEHQTPPADFRLHRADFFKEFHDHLEIAGSGDIQFRPGQFVVDAGDPDRSQIGEQQFTLFGVAMRASTSSGDSSTYFCIWREILKQVILSLFFSCK